MKLATFTTDASSGPLGGVVNGERVRAFARGAAAVRDVLAGTISTEADLGQYALSDVQLLAPIPHPGTIFAIGLNYADHIAEMGHASPEWPTVFLKVANSATAPSGPVVKPAGVGKLDYEGELMIAIGQGGTAAAYCVADDVTGRDLQGREPQWVRGKGADTFCPFGPWLTTADEVPDPGNLAIRTWVNGELRQSSNTSNLVFGIEALLAFISETCTLRAGDLILTGTPGGVGQGMSPPRYLQSGDTVRIEVESLGQIEHSVS